MLQRAGAIQVMRTDTKRRKATGGPPQEGDSHGSMPRSYKGSLRKAVREEYLSQDTATFERTNELRTENGTEKLTTAGKIEAAKERARLKKLEEDY